MMNNRNWGTAKDDRTALEVAGIGTDENGNLIFPEWSRINLLVPPKVDLDYLEGKRIVRYPVPDAWVDKAKVKVDYKALMMKGWQPRADNDNLLEEFVELGRLGDTDDAADEVASFAERWGPLWTCRGISQHYDCHWSYVGGMRLYDPCGWAPHEFVEDFMAKGRQARAALLAAKRLRDGKPITKELWFDLQYPKVMEGQVGQIAEDMAHMDLPVQHWFFTEVVDYYLSIMQGHPGVHLSWHQGEEQATLVVTSGLGFVRAAWLMIGQIIASTHSILVCDGCGKPYARQGRSPKKGGRNFCPKCGPEGDYKISKRRYWQEKHSPKERGQGGTP